MKWIKYSAVTLIAVVAGAALILGSWLATRDDADYLRMVQRLVFKTAGVKLAVSGDFKVNLAWDAVVQAQGVSVIDPKGAEAQPPLVALQTFKVKLALWPLFWRTLVIKDLVLADAVITVPGQTAPPSLPLHPGPRKMDNAAVPLFMPLFEQVHVNRVAIVLPRRGTTLPLKIWLGQFDARAAPQPGADGRIELAGQGRLDDRPYTIRGSMGTIETFMDRSAPFPLDVTLTTEAVTARANGVLQHGLLGNDLELQIACQGAELARILETFGIRTPPLGRVDGHAALAGSVRNPRLTDLRLTVDNASGLDLTVSGEIKAPVSFEEVDLALSGTCRDPALLAWLLPETVPPVEAIELNGYLKEREGSFFLECAPLTVSGPQGARLTGTGNMWLGRRTGAPDPQNQIDLQLDLQAPSVAALFEADTAPAVLKAFQPVKATAVLRGLYKDMALDKIALQAGDSQTMAIEATGAIGRIRAQDVHPVSAVMLQGRLAAADPALLVPGQAARLAALGTLRCDFTLQDVDGVLRLTDTRVQVEGPSSIQAAVEGTWSASNRIEFDVNTRTTAADLSALPGLEGLALPDFKRIDVAVKIARRDKCWDATTFEARCYGGENEALHIAGNVRDLLGVERTVLEVEFTGDPTQDVFSGKALKTALPEQVHGQAVIGRDAAGFTIERLVVECRGLGNMTGQMAGTIKPGQGTYAGALETEMRINDPEALLAAFGVEYPHARAVHIRGRVTGNHHKPVFAGRIAWGDNQMDATVAVDLSGSRPKVQIDAVAQTYQVTGFERRSQAGASASIKVKRRQTGKPRRLFSEQPLDLVAIKGLDLMLRVQAAQLGILGFNLADVDLNLKQAGGRLRIDPLVFKYTGGEVDLGFTLDASKPVPDWAMDIKARGIVLEQLLTDLYAKADLGGTLTLAVELKSQGQSPRAIAAALTGDAGLAVEQGWLPQSADLLAADVFDALLTLPTPRQRKELSCLVTRFGFDKGLGTSRILSMDTQDFSALGGGTIDLRNETLDLLINPKQKKRLVLSESSPVRIFGPLTKLSFSKMPYREAAKLYGDILIPVIGISDRVLGFLWDAVKPAAGEESPCYVAPTQ